MWIEETWNFIERHGQIKYGKGAEEQSRWGEGVSVRLGYDYLIISYCAPDVSLVAPTSYCN